MDYRTAEMDYWNDFLHGIILIGKYTIVCNKYEIMDAI